MRNRYLMTMAAAVAALLALPSTATAHCDSMDGPVVKAAQQALATGNVALALVWVRVEDEPGIREAFAKTMAVRRLNPEARTLADQWFFETLVRVHRAGEGAPYTGLKPAGTEPPKGIAAADRALADAALEPLLHAVTEHLGTALRARYERVQALARYDPADVAAGRAYVHAYVEFIHFVEGLVAVVHGEGAAAHSDH